ncbi:hypothetical protein [Modestobacter sp. VKM Ac-2985]|nr:hypothetical protein [Modestobacter sp. VKM Ac-2985]MCZ2839134.1 hypothetical protein [Modestobacter sp. VKM Ac-2985]
MDNHLSWTESELEAALEALEPPAVLAVVPAAPVHELPALGGADRRSAS